MSEDCGLESKLKDMSLKNKKLKINKIYEMTEHEKIVDYRFIEELLLKSDDYDFIVKILKKYYSSENLSSNNKLAIAAITRNNPLLLNTLFHLKLINLTKDEIIEDLDFNLDFIDYNIILCLLKNSNFKDIYISGNWYCDDQYLFKSCVTFIDPKFQKSIKIVKRLEKDEKNNINDVLIEICNDDMMNHGDLFKLIYNVNYSGTKFNLCEFLYDIIIDKVWANGYYINLIEYIYKYINKELFINYILMKGYYNIFSFPLFDFKDFILNDSQILYIYGFIKKLNINGIHLLQNESGFGSCEYNFKPDNELKDTMNLINKFDRYKIFKTKKEIMEFIKNYINIGNLSYNSKKYLVNIHINKI